MFSLSMNFFLITTTKDHRPKTNQTHLKIYNMDILIFNGSQDSKKTSTSALITTFIKERIEEKGHSVTFFNLADVSIPFLDLKSKAVPDEVHRMARVFRAAHAHIWLSPLY